MEQPGSKGFPGGSEGKVSAYDVGDLGQIPGLGRSSGEGNGNPLQYSCLENPMDREAWQATVHGVAKSRTRLSDFTSLHQEAVSHDNTYSSHHSYSQPLVPSLLKIATADRSLNSQTNFLPDMLYTQGKFQVFCPDHKFFLHQNTKQPDKICQPQKIQCSPQVIILIILHTSTWKDISSLGQFKCILVGKE